MIASQLLKGYVITHDITTVQRAWTLWNNVKGDEARNALWQIYCNLRDDRESYERRDPNSLDDLGPYKLH